MADRIGQHFGNYQLVRLLGQGGYAEVYLGQHLRLNQQAAIKVLHAHLTETEAEHFQQEAQTIATLVHPGIVRVFDYDVQEGVPFLVMDYAPNGTLRHRYPRGGLVPLSVIVSSVKQVASALQYAHEQKFIHRDVKPENMVLGRRDEVLLSDFGIATIAHSTSSSSASAQGTAGTIAYMAPEQLEGHPRASSDQYALGVVVYEWLSGQRPFKGSMSEMIVQHLTMPPPPLRERVPTVSAEMEQVVLQALAKDPGERFACVQDFALALEEACRTEVSSGHTLLALSSASPANDRHTSTTNLPAPLTPLLGREQEVATACTLMRRPDVRLVTFTGTGGVGKTCLGLQVAAHLLEDFADGVSFVSLAPLSQPDLVLPALAQTFNLRETPGWLPLEHLKSYLHEKQLLVLLDNFEQVIAAAPMLVALLQACPALKMLVTSRVRLRVSGEFEFSVQPLALPDPKHLPDYATLLGYAAVALFVQRAQAIKPSFQLTAGNGRTIAEICLRLDGLPLAIELAAVRLKLLSPQVLLERLSQRLQVLTAGVQDAPVRQQTLRNTIAWSYDLLDAAEQRLFRRLSVFVGGCTLEAVEALCTALDGGAEGVLDGVISLLDKSLLQQIEQDEEPRLMMLETIREYGLEALIVSGELENTRQAHALYYLAFAEEAAPNLYGAEQQSWFARLEQEHDNLRTAFNCLIARNEAELTLRLGDALRWFWLIHGPLSEGRRCLEQALSGSEGSLPSVRANVLSGLGLLLFNQGDYEQAKGRCEESVALYRELGDRDSMAWPLHHLAMVEFYQGKFTRARSLLEECLEGFSERGDKAGRAYALDHLALLAIDQGEYDKAYSYAQEGLTLFRTLEDTIGVGDALFCLMNVLISSQSGKMVHPLLEESLALARETGDEVNMLNALHIAGRIALSEGDFPTARSYIEESLALAREKVARADVAELLVVLAQITAAQGDYVAAQELYEESLAHAKELDFKRVIPTSLEGLAAAVAAQGEPIWAAYLWGAAESLRQTIGAPLPPIQQAAYEQAVTATRAQLGEAAFVSAWQEGRTMTPEQALAAQGAATSPPPTLTKAPSTAPTKTVPTYPVGLTAREMEVLRLVAQGMTNPQIAERLILSLHTVNAHVRSIYTKLELNSRSALTRYALEHLLL